MSLNNFVSSPMPTSSNPPAEGIWIFPAIHMRRWILILIVGSFVASLTYSFAYRIAPVVDAQAYDKIAQNLVAGNGFREDATKSFIFDTAIVRAGPGYEFSLAGLYTVFGHHYEVVWVVQALLHALSALLLFFICRSIFPDRGEKIGVIAALVFGLHPDLIEISAMLMTETLYLFLIILVVHCFVRLYTKGATIGQSALLGSVVALSVLTRPPTILFVPILLYFFWQRKRLSSGIVFLGFLGLVLLPWVVRNYSIFHQPILTTLIGSYNIWVGNTLLSDGGQIAGGFNAATTFASANGFVGFKAAATHAFFSFLFNHPIEFIKLCFVRTIRYFSLIRPMGFWFYQTGIKQAIFVASSAVVGVWFFISGYAGLTQSIRERRGIYWYLVAMALCAPLPLLLTVVQSRYRFQIYPFLAIFAGYAWVTWESTGWWRNRYLQGTVIVLAIVSLVDVLLNFGPVITHLRLFL